MDHLAARLAHHIVTYTQDYADHSPYLRRYLHKLTTILPPVELPEPREEDVRAMARRFNPQGHRPVIGMAARLAAEKGVEVLLNALPRVLEHFPQAMVWFAGPYENVLGEEAYRRKVLPLAREWETQIEAMMHGVPVVASNLPGVRQPVKMTGMGEIAAVGDAEDLARALLQVLRHPERYQGDPEAVRATFSPDRVAQAYESLFQRLLAEIRG